VKTAVFMIDAATKSYSAALEEEYGVRCREVPLQNVLNNNC